ncbi:type IV pilin protein [Caldimonas sp. KR1-144]|uniref:type IV pilin protein n=1 Tax=Caldimonas sp. KR1-144 TaxID=3400911 RepID=UPI003C077C8E
MPARALLSCRSTHSRGRGFTLIELMITVAVVAVLAMVAYPSFMDQVRKSRRSEAISALAQIQQAQERFRANDTSYTTALTTAWPSGLGISSPTSSGYYTLAISSASSVGYVATATAAGSQASDSKCTSLTITVSGGSTQYTSTGSASANTCWNR